jgi:hypothetical protein
MSEVMLNRLVPLWNVLCQSAQREGCATPKDVEFLRNRTVSEGLPYLTTGLAGFGRTFLGSIRRGYVLREEVSASRHKPKVDSTLPLFLYDAWSKVFNDDGTGIGATFESLPDGTLTLTSWDPPLQALVAVRWLRQLTVVFSKLRIPHDDASARTVFERFRANEDKLAQEKGRLWATQYALTTSVPHSRHGTQPLQEVLLNARRIVHKLLCNLDPREIEPRHGSGASACRTTPWERYDRILFDPEINAIWPYLEFVSAGKDHTDQILSSEFINNGYPKRARGVFVPKDYRGPRLISCEPASSMYYQQGLMTLLVEHLETAPQTSGFVNFTNQRINQDLARKGSSERKLATLDLKDASDLLSWDLIILLWPEHWLKALSAVRSKVTDIDVPGEGTMTVPLRKHAPMGSATCFPVMALTIWALIKAAHITTKPEVWIYGDDIVVASKGAQSVCDMLEAVGLMVNRDKSFFGATPFRESCGKEYWCGGDVTPIYCRYNPDTADSETASLCSFAHNWVASKGSFAAINIVEYIHGITNAPIIGLAEDFMQYVEASSDASFHPLIGQLTESTIARRKFSEKLIPLVLFGPMFMCQRNTLKRRWNKNLQRFEFRVRSGRPLKQAVKPVTWGYVLRSSLIGGDLGFAESAPLAKRTVYKYSWVSIDW